MELLNLELKDNEWEEEYINHDRYIARAIVIDDDNYFYFVHITRDDDFGNATYIETSGGGVEDDEDLTKAIKRELSEELGIEAIVIAKIGVVSDYYNLIHRHNINNYFLCKIKAFGKKHLTEDEEKKWHLTTVKLSFEEAKNAYKAYATTKIARLVYNREYPILLRAKEILDEINMQ